MKFKGVLIAAAAASFFAVGTANAVPASSDVVFLVDESGSMGGEHAFLQNVINDLDAALGTAGVGTRNYGVVGYGAGGAGNLGRDLSGGLVGLAPATTALSSLVTTGSFEDGYSAIDFAISTYALTSEAVNFILVTDEDRDNGNGALTAASIQSTLISNGIILNAVVNASLEDALNNTALGIDNAGDAYLADGLGGFTTSAGGVAVSGAGSTIVDYIDVALATGGAAWDLNQLRAGGLTAESFTAAFIDIKVDEVITQPPRVSEPAVIAMMGMGIVGVAIFRRRTA